MKIAGIAMLLAVAAGAAIGWGTGFSQYGRATAYLGPFSTDSDLTAKEIDRYLSAADRQEQPILEVEGGAEHDFGVMRRGESREHTFVLRNVGTARLDLELLGSSCKCTVGKLDRDGLEPGESTDVKLQWEAQESGSSFAQSARLRTNDPQAVEVALRITGAIVDTIALEPSAWTVGDIASGEPIVLTATAFNHGETPLQLASASWLDSAVEELSRVQVTPRAVDPQMDGHHGVATQAFDIQATIAPGLGQGALQHQLRLRFSPETEARGAEEVVTQIPLHGRLVGSLSLVGGSQLSGRQGGNYRLRLGEIPAGKGKSTTVHVTLRGEHRDEATLHIGEVTPPEVLEAELGEPTQRGTMTVYPLVVRVREDAPDTARLGNSDEDFGMVWIASDRPEVAPLRLRVTFQVGKPYGAL